MEVIWLTMDQLIFRKIFFFFFHLTPTKVNLTKNDIYATAISYSSTYYTSNIHEVNSLLQGFQCKQSGSHKEFV